MEFIQFAFLCLTLSHPASSFSSPDAKQINSPLFRGFSCEMGAGTLPEIRRLRTKVAAAARVGFDIPALALAYPEAMILFHRWSKFVPHNASSRDIILGGSVATGAKKFVFQLFGKQFYYCFFAHITAIFVVLRLRPLVFVSETWCARRSPIRGKITLKKSRTWVARTLHCGKRQLPMELITDIYLSLHKALLLYGLDRSLDQSALVGWSVSSAEIVELAEAIRTVCLESPSGCTLQKFERTIQSRLRGARHVAVAIVNKPPLDGLRPSAFSIQYATRQFTNKVSYSRYAASDRKYRLVAFMAGTHGALFKEIRTSWGLTPTAETEFSSVVCNELSFKQSYAAGSAFSAPEKSALPRDIVARLPMNLGMHHYVSVYSTLELLRAIMIPWLHRLKGDEAAVLVCTIPAITCAAFAVLPLPVVHYSPTVAAVQVPLQNFRPWLVLYSKMARDPKNHFIVSSPSLRDLDDTFTRLKLQDIPPLSLYMNTTYIGHRSRRVLVFDRIQTLLVHALHALSASTDSFDFVHHFQTDRRYSTFAKHKAMIFVPTAFTQMAFWEFYSMAIPIFVPVDLGRYLWPPLPFSLVGTVLHADPSYAKTVRHAVDDRRYEHWKGSYIVHSSSENIFAGMNITFRQSRVPSVFIENVDLNAELVPLRSMDEFGNTHTLEFNSSFGGGRCLRVSNMLGFVQGFLAPPVGTCPGLDTVEGCRSGPIKCRGSLWLELEFEELHPFADHYDPKPVDHKMRSGFGEFYWYLGRAVSRGARVRTTIFTHRHLYHYVRDGQIDMFFYPEVRRFRGVANLFSQLEELPTRETSEAMRRFTQEQRNIGLSSWRNVLREVVQHPSQQLLSTDPSCLF